MESVLDILITWFGSTLGKTYTLLGMILPIIITSTWLAFFVLQHRFTRGHSEHRVN